MRIKVTEEVGQVRIDVPWNSVTMDGNIGCAFFGWLAMLVGGIYLISQVTGEWTNGMILALIGGSIFFIAATVGLYRAIASQNNRLEIIIGDDGTFHAREYPIYHLSYGPFPVKLIKQFYIRELYLNQRRYFSLRVRRTNGTEKRLAVVREDEYAELRELETIFEQRLGLSEQKMKREFRPGSLGESAAPRPASYHAQSSGSHVQRLNSSATNTLKIKDKIWDIIFVQQFDWAEGGTSYAFHLTHGEERMHVYRSQFLQLFEREPLDLPAQKTWGLRVENDQLGYHSHQLELIEKQSGLAFRTHQHHQPGIDCEEYHFCILGTRKIVRVLRFGEMLEAYRDRRCD